VWAAKSGSRQIRGQSVQTEQLVFLSQILSRSHELVRAQRLKTVQVPVLLFVITRLSGFLLFNGYPSLRLNREASAPTPRALLQGDGGLVAQVCDFLVGDDRSCVCRRPLPLPRMQIIVQMLANHLATLRLAEFMLSDAIIDVPRIFPSFLDREQERPRHVWTWMKVRMKSDSVTPQVSAI